MSEKKKTTKNQFILIMMYFQTPFEVQFCRVSRIVVCVSFSPILNWGVGKGKDDGKGKELKDIWGSGGSRYQCMLFSQNLSYLLCSYEGDCIITKVNNQGDYWLFNGLEWGFLPVQLIKNLPAMQET